MNNREKTYLLGDAHKSECTQCSNFLAEKFIWQHLDCGDGVSDMLASSIAILLLLQISNERQVRGQHWPSISIHPFIEMDDAKRSMISSAFILAMLDLAMLTAVVINLQVGYTKLAVHQSSMSHPSKVDMMETWRFYYVVWYHSLTNRSSGGIHILTI